MFLTCTSQERLESAQTEQSRQRKNILDFARDGDADLVRDCITEFEHSRYFLTPVCGEPQLGRRGLYHAVHARTVADEVLLRTHVLAYCDGQHSVRDIAELCETEEQTIQALMDELLEHDLVRETAPRRTTP